MFSLSRFLPEVECRDVMTAEDKCYFILHTEDCMNGDGLLNYLSLLYCNKLTGIFTGGIIGLIIWLFFLFIGLADTANNFFCPALQVIAEKLKLSHNLAGVTLLALGNGAPDIFSSLAGIKQGRSELVFGELFGAGIFVTTIVSGTICLITPFHVMERPFLRDCIFYLSAVYFVFWVFYHHTIVIGYAVGFIVLYVVYAGVVVIGRLINSRMLRYTHVIHDNSDEQLNNQQNLNSEEPTFIVNTDAELLSSRPEVNGHLDHIVVLPSIRQSIKEEFSDFITCLQPFTLEQWNNDPWYGKALRVAGAPFRVVLKLTVPLVDNELRRNGWCRSLQCLQMITIPTWTIWTLGYGDILIAKILPLSVLILLIGCAFSVLLFIFTDKDSEPSWHWITAFVAFISSILWINFIANEIVAILFTFGVVFNWSDGILGLTVLAWGNSVGDFASDITMAKQNAPRMGFSACYGAPLLNTLLGLGISFTVMFSQLGTSVSITVPFQNLSQLMSAFLVLSLVFALVLLPITGFQAGKRLGFGLYAIYIVFLVLAILQEADILWPDIQ